MSRHAVRMTAATVALWGLACAKDATGPRPRLTLSPATHAVSVRDDSVMVSADSAFVAITGADSLTAPWVATHTAASWDTLTTAGGTGRGFVRWSRDASLLDPGTHVDTITVTVQSSGGGTARILDSLTLREAPARFIAVRRAWRAGERDSTAAFVLRSRAWGEYSDVAALAYASWDSATDVVRNPAWQPPIAGSPAARRAPRASEFDAAWAVMGLSLLTVFDSIPGGAIQRDSIAWQMVRWWNPADSTWQGFMVRASAALTFGKGSVNTTSFNASGGSSGTGGGETRLASLTYWEGNGGQYNLALNGSYPTWSHIPSGPYLGGDQATGTMAGQLKNINMPRILGTDTPTAQSFSYNFSTTPINSIAIRCYFAPITPPSGFHQCTGAAFARLVAAARAGTLDARTAAGLLDPALPSPPRRLRRARRTRRSGRRWKAIAGSGHDG